MGNKFTAIAGRLVITFGLMALLTWVTFMLLGKPLPGVDDAYIFLTYGKNTANGLGFVYNPGGERVEGFSSFLWQIIVNLAFIVTRHPQVWLQILSLMMVSGAVTVLWYFVDGGTAVTSRGLLLLVWVFGSPSFIIWNGLTLMDTALWTGLLTLGTVVTLTPRLNNYLILLAPLILLARPEGMLWGIVFVLLLFWLIASQKGVRTGWQAAKWPLVAYLVTLAGLIGWRLWYFQYPLPNTYYAKVSPDIRYNLVQGGIYLRDFLAGNPFVALMAFGASFSIIVLNLRWVFGAIINPPIDKVRAKAIATALIIIVGFLVPAWAGGDHFQLFRFYQPIWPVLLLPTFSLIDLLQENPFPRSLQYGLFTAATLIFLLLPGTNWFQSTTINKIAPEFELAQAGLAIGRQLNEMFPQERPSVGEIVVGGFGYAYEGPVIDVMGLNNVQMAHMPGLRYGKKNHAAFNQDVFLRQAPQLFLPEMVAGNITEEIGCPQLSDDLLTWPNSALNGMLSEEIFWQKYTRGLITRNHQTLLVYINKDYVNTLLEQGFSVTFLNCYP